ncbi:hypothetical protein [Mycobacterium canetti]|uniref:hypothetical protein n=1 Tax=Mycobacterium canetti TaxID=78331 RepID=UPI0005C5327C|nr:hypothetical protein [Mycobacterium canetti]
MRYFTDGLRVARVHTDESFGDAFLEARGETFHIVKNAWVERPDLTREIMFRGDWGRSTLAEVEQRIAERQRQRQAS